MSIILSIQPTLQALLLSLKELETLSSNEIENLRNIADRLASGYKWETEIQPKLLEIINENYLFEQQFKQASNQLEKMSDEEISNLFPTITDLEKVIPSELRYLEKPAIPNALPDRDGNHLANMVVEVLATENPVKTTQKLFQEKEKNKVKNTNCS